MGARGQRVPPRHTGQPMSERNTNLVVTIGDRADNRLRARRGRTASRIFAVSVLLMACNQPALPRPPPESLGPVPRVAPGASNRAKDCQLVTSQLAKGRVRIDGRKFGPEIAVELAVEENQRNCGLMHRQSLAEDAGMLFFMPYDDHWAFYMRNTYIPLDMIFIDKDWSVVGVSGNTRPLTEERHRSPKRCRYVLELAAHQARRNGIVAGTRLVYDGPPQGGDQEGAN